MKCHTSMPICPMLIIFLSLLILAPHAVLADYGYNYSSDRINREHRDAGNVEDWIERGNATVTASPRFENGIRLTAWASESGEEENYEFAIASAIYLFEIPQQAQYVEILVRYRGEPHLADFDYEEIAGRVWIRNTKREYARTRYNDNSDDETLYGDTFFLRAKRRSETIKIATAGRVDNGLLEVHIVAENGEHLDVEYIDVRAYQRQPDVRVIHRYARDYHWKPWYRYTYLYFYDGPFYYCTDLGYYIRWSYPVYDHHYVAIRRAYGGYLHNYSRRYPRRYHRNSYYHVGVHVNTSSKRRRLNRWTATHENTRREYSRGRLSVTASKTNKTNVQTRVRSLITEHRQAPVPTKRVSQRSTASQKRKMPDARGQWSRAIQQQRINQQSHNDTSNSYYQATQRILKRKRVRTVERGTQSNRGGQSNVQPRTYQYDRFRFSPKDRRSSDNQMSTRSNEERRARLHNRAQSSSRSRLSTPSSRSRSSNAKQRVETRSRSKQTRSRSSTATAPRIQRPTTQKATSSSSSKDDDEKKERSRNTTRTQTRSRRK